MSFTSSIRLTEADPDLVRFLSPEERAAAAQVELPAHFLTPAEFDLRSLLRRHHAFGAIVLDGMILQSLRLGEHAGLRLIGPADVLSLTGAPTSMLVLDASARATVATRLVVLEREFLLAARRWPWLIGGLHARSGEQAERLLTQTMICQLPRVDDRVLSLMWLLAESWGQVTASGTVLPIELTHSALGGLIGARRPTVTLALSELSERGALVRQAGGWLLLEPPARTLAAPAEAVGLPRPLDAVPADWDAAPDLTAPDNNLEVYAHMRETVERLRSEHLSQKAAMRERLHQLIASREEVAELRRQIRESSRRRVPSA